MAIRFDYSGKTVVVVGGTSGINLGIAREFAIVGARVAVASRNLEKVERAVAELEELGAEAMGFIADVRQLEAVEEGFQSVADRWGRFDVLVSGAAGNFPALANDMSSNAFRSVIEIDLLGTFHVLKAAFPHLNPGASVINISAPQASVPMAAQSHVCAAKAGVDMVTRSLALEWAESGIRVNGVVPGPVAETEGVDRLAPTEKMRWQLEQSIPAGRLGNKRDVANLCLFLGAEESAFINGAVIPVDGGFSLAGAAITGSYLKKMLKNS